MRRPSRSVTWHLFFVLVSCRENSHHLFAAKWKEDRELSSGLQIECRIFGYPLAFLSEAKECAPSSCLATLTCEAESISLRMERCPRSSAKKLERLRAFFRFAQKRKWVTENPALDLKAPKITLCPPFHLAAKRWCEFSRQLTNTKKRCQVTGSRTDGAFASCSSTSLQRDANGDGVNFSTDRLEGTVSSSTRRRRVSSEHNPSGICLIGVGSNAKKSQRSFLLERKGKLESIVRSWQTRLRKLFKLANVPNGHAHRFRDTFAVELLLAGVPIERVSILLGHQSVRITEKHYAPWVRSRQEQLEADLANAWSRDPLVLSQAAPAL